MMRQAMTEEPPTPRAGDITCLFERASEGDRDAFEEAVRLVYPELERVAERQLGAHYGARAKRLTLEPAALVNESLLKLLRRPRNFDNRRHFYSFVMRVMTRVMFDYQRRKGAEKRGGGEVHVTLGEVDAKTPTYVGLSELAAALDRLGEFDARKAEVVKLRVFIGLEMAEIAETLSVSLATVEREWRFSRSWLAAELRMKNRSA